MFHIFLIISFFLVIQHSNGNDDPDRWRNAVEVIESRGYQAEIHNITTKDGYLLTVHRIINPLLGEPDKKPILLQHGLFSSSIDWIINSPGSGINSIPFDKFANEAVKEHNIIGNNLGFVLSDLGYDVWLGNTRGNKYSSNHNFFNNSDNGYWQFSFDEMIQFDLPAVIDHILNITHEKTLGYVGHSQGTLIMFGLLSTQEKYNDIIKPFIAMAPVTTVKNIRSPIRILATSDWLLDHFYHSGGKFLPSNALMTYLSNYICSTPMTKTICYNAAFLFCGFDINELNVTRLEVYYQHTPSGTSAWNLVHYGQMYRSGQFRKFDYGNGMNWKMYGSYEPPVYPLGNITSRYISLIYSDNDWLADLNDIATLIKSLKVELFVNHRINRKSWNHLDFIWGKHAGLVVNTVVVNILKKFD